MPPEVITEVRVADSRSTVQNLGEETLKYQAVEGCCFDLTAVIVICY